MAEVKSIQPENDVFCSVYRKDYIFWKDHERVTKMANTDEFRMTPEMLKKFLQIEMKPDFSKMEQYLEDLKELNKLRLQTVYELEYPVKSSYKILRNTDREMFSPKNDTFLIDGAVQFGEPHALVLPPLPSSRRVFPYSPYKDYRTPLSTYQDIHCRVGYERIKEAAEAGYWRMGPRYDHEKEMEEINSTLKRESDIKERESEEKRMEEEKLKQQIVKEREDFVKKSLGKKENKKRGTTWSNRFGTDPRKKSSNLQPAEAASNNEITVKLNQTGSKVGLCRHTKEEHEECLRKKMLR